MLCSAASGKSAQIQTATAVRQHKRKHKQTEHLRIFTFKQGPLKVSLHLQTACASETHLAKEQWQEEQMNLVKLTNVNECSE